MKLPDTDQELVLWTLQHAGTDFLQAWQSQPDACSVQLGTWIQHQMQHRPECVRIVVHQPHTSHQQSRVWVQVRVCNILVESARVSPHVFNLCYADHHAPTGHIKE
ncbi:MAG: hypothetical protein CMF61_07885 [Magnetococcales bacterium]|nr:hypothetical protein [Magnetococcales bacterium]